MSSFPTVLLLGASGPCGQAFIQRMEGRGVSLIAVSRRPPARTSAHVLWLQQDLDLEPVSMEASVLVSAGPLIHALRQVEAGTRLGRVVALSSASTLFKSDSRDPEERALMQRLIDQEDALALACEQRDIRLTLLKPTLIYGGDSSSNVGRVSGLAARLPVLPYCGRGLRHPVHASDLAELMERCLVLGDAAEGRWLLGGGETIEYPTMLRRMAASSGSQPRLLRVPLWLMRLALASAHGCGRLRDLKAVMLMRQGVDLVVDDTPARHQLGWSPRRFLPGVSGQSGNSV